MKGLEFASLQLQARTSGLTEEDLRRAALASADAMTAGRRSAWVHLNAGRSKEALTLADGLVRALSKEAPALRARALVVRGQLNLELRRFGAAEKDLRKALAEDPRCAGASVLLGGVLLQEGNLPAALEALGPPKTDEPGSEAERRALRSIILGRLGRGGEAARELAAALSGEPRRACGPLSGVDRSSLPLGFFDACLSRIADDATLFVDRGVARFLSKDAAGAEADFRAGLRLKPDSLEAAMSLASLLGAGRRAEALPVMEAALARAEARKAEAVYRRAASLRDSLRQQR